MPTKTKPVKKALTSAEMKVAIAKDVIAQLKAKKPKIKVYEGVYFVASLKKPFAEVGDDLQEAASKIVSCEVCALGAVFLSKARLYNDCPMSIADGWHGDDGKCLSFNDDDMRLNLDSLFSNRQLRSIEAAFEGFSSDFSCIYPDGRERMFYEQHDDNKDRMIAIMKNIIANKGEFVLPKPKYTTIS